VFGRADDLSVSLDSSGCRVVQRVLDNLLARIVGV
jgi:hypothetical protein